MDTFSNAQAELGSADAGWKALREGRIGIKDVAVSDHRRRVSRNFHGPVVARRGGL
jgi:hypothetical protein